MGKVVVSLELEVGLARRFVAALRDSNYALLDVRSPQEGIPECRGLLAHFRNLLEERLNGSAEAISRADR